MSRRAQITIRNDKEGLIKLIRRVNGFLESEDISDTSSYKANLVVEEIITNVLKYGYEDEQKGKIRVKMRTTKKKIHIECSDNGREFDPLSAPSPDWVKRSEEFQPGGVGIHLIRQMSDSIQYSRENDRNVLKVSIALSA